MSTAVELVNAIVARLNTAEFSMPFTAYRRTVPIVEVERLRSLEVYVLLNTKRAERRTQRGANAYRKTYKPVVVVQKKLTAGTNEEAKQVETDSLMALVQEIEEALETVELNNLHFLGYDENADRESFAGEIMSLADVFAVAITLEYTD